MELWPALFSIVDLIIIFPIGGSDGNFVMFHISGDGLKPNHFLFSSCSINYMYKLILDRFHICFVDNYKGFCSNAILDSKYVCIL